MNPVKTKALIILLLFMSVITAPAVQLHNLDIQVELLDNSDATCTKTRSMDVDENTSECMNTLSNDDLNDVTDSSKTYFKDNKINLEEWAYGHKESLSSFGTIVIILIVVGFIAVVIVGVVVPAKALKRLKEEIDWYQDIPADGNLFTANNILDAYGAYKGNQTENIITAMIYRMMTTGTITIDKPSERGIQRESINIHQLDRSNRLLDAEELEEFHFFLWEAAGEDVDLGLNELKKWISWNKHDVDDYFKKVNAPYIINDFKNREEEVHQVIGMKMFLDDFLLANREIQNVELWKEYLVYAALFGILDEVRNDMERLYPEFFEMDKIAAQMKNGTKLQDLIDTTISYVKKAINAIEEEKE